MNGSVVGDAYLDACSLIYLVEGAPPWRRATEDRLRELAPSGLLTSLLSRLECRSKPLRDGNRPLLGLYDAALDPSCIRMIEISADVIERATELRARYGFRAPDSIHLATAICARASVFVSGDAALKRCTEITVDLVTAVN
jgi:predicted nucleic acid-binding protein